MYTLKFSLSEYILQDSHGAKYIWKYLSNVQVLSFVKYNYKYSSWNQKYT